MTDLRQRLGLMCAEQQWAELANEMLEMPMSMILELARVLYANDNSAARTSAGPDLVRSIETTMQYLRTVGLGNAILTADVQRFGLKSEPQPLQKIDWSPEVIPTIAISGDGGTIAVAEGDRSSVRVIAPSSGKTINTVQLDGHCLSLSLSTSGKNLLVSTQQEREFCVNLYDVVSGTHKGHLRRRRDSVNRRPDDGAAAIAIVVAMAGVYAEAVPVVFAEDDSVLMLNEGNAIRTYSCDDGMLLHEFSSDRPRGYAGIVKITDDYVVTGNTVGAIFCRLPFGDVEREQKLPGLLVGYAPKRNSDLLHNQPSLWDSDELFISTDKHNSVSVLDHNGKLVRNFKVNSPRSSISSTVDCRVFSPRFQLCNSINLFHSLDGSSTVIELSTPENLAQTAPTIGAPAIVALSSSGFATIQFGNVWYCPSGARSADSPWRMTIINLGRKVLKQTSKQDKDIIDQMLKQGWHSNDERALLCLWGAAISAAREYQPDFAGGVQLDFSVPSESLTAGSQHQFEPKRAAGIVLVVPKAAPQSVPENIEQFLLSDPEPEDVWGLVAHVSAVSARDLLKYLRKHEWAPEVPKELAIYQELQQLAVRCNDAAIKPKLWESPINQICRAPVTNYHGIGERDFSHVGGMDIDAKRRWAITVAHATDRPAIRLWDLETSQTTRHIDFTYGTTFVMANALNGSSTRFAVEFVSQMDYSEKVNPKIALFSVPEFELLQVLEPEGEYCVSHELIFSNDDRKMLSLMGRSIRVWNTETCELERSIQVISNDAHKNASIYGLSLSLDNTLIAVTYSLDGKSGILELRRFDDGFVLATQQLAINDVRHGSMSVRFGPECVITICDTTVSLWRMDLTPMSSWSHPGWDAQSRILAVISPDGTYLALAKRDESRARRGVDYDSEIAMVRLPDWKEVELFKGPFNSVYRLKFSRAGDEVFVATSNGLWSCVSPLQACDSEWREFVERILYRPVNLISKDDLARLASALSTRWFPSRNLAWAKLLLLLAGLQGEHSNK
jgi:WD40 repeat protein